MRVIIAANGDASSPKLVGRHFALVDGEPLLARTVRQLTGHDVIVSGPDMRYSVAGAALYVPKREPENLDADIVLSTRHLWAANDRTLLLLGDTYFSDEAIDSIVGLVQRRWFYIGREHGSEFSGTDYGELFGLSFWPEHQAELLDAMLEVRRRQADDGLWRGGMWEHYRVLRGIDPLEHRIDGNFLEIDDETDDLDFGDQAATWAERTGHELVVPAAPRVVFLVPRRNDNGHRDRLWEYARARWQRYFPDVAIFEGHHDDGPFNRAAAINRAAALAGDWDVGIVIDSDVMLSVSQVRAAIARALSTGRVTWAHRRWRGIREDAAIRILDDQRDLGAEINRDELDLIVDRTNPLSWSCCIAIPRAVWDDLGGFDERFRGWGYEDMAFQSVVCGLYGHERIEGDVVHLWHPRSEERIVKGQSRDTATPEYVVNARLGRRYMVALRRDHQLHDRGDLPASEEERQRDIGNLQRDDAKYTDIARRLGLPDWSEWWPTLEELRDGAKGARDDAPRERTVTIVVTTGGDEHNWPERSGYLRQALASLSERVTGPIVQRVVYSDWAGHRDELVAIAEEHGFYVAGQGHHGYTGARRRLWAYLARRARGQYVFAAEDDFVYDRDVDLTPMIEALEQNPELRQLALLRGAFYPRELEAGGVLQSLATPHELVNHRPHPFVTHRDHFTANPSLFRRSLTSVEWPNASSSERVFGDTVLRDPAARFAYWGAGEPWISHLGAVRAGTGY